MDNNPRLRDRDLIFIDVETTGPVFDYHEIIDIAMIRTSPDGRSERERWHLRLRPRFPERVTDLAKQLNGFDASEWAAEMAPTTEIWQKVSDVVNGSVPVCHNPSFDRAFIMLAAGRMGVEDLGLDYHWIGTESLAWPLYGSGEIEELSLDALSGYFGGSEEPVPHTALRGAETCRHVFISLMSRYEVGN